MAETQKTNNNAVKPKRKRRQSSRDKDDVTDATALTKPEPEPEPEPEQPVLRGAVARGHETYFHPDDLAHYELAQYKVETASLRAQLIESELKRIRIEHERRLEVLGARLRLARQAKKQKGADLLRLQTRVGDKYGLDLSVVAYDDETGKINRLPT